MTSTNIDMVFAVLKRRDNPVNPLIVSLAEQDYTDMQERITALETAGRPIKETLDNLIADNHLESPEILNNVWVSVLGSHLVKFAALLGETK